MNARQQPRLIYMLTLYDKTAKDDLTPAERGAWRRIVEEFDND